jgi:transcriptional regulator with XRE-family HTH domain
MKPISPIDRYAIKKVKEKRIAMGYSQAALSYELDVTSGFIAQAENDNYKTRYSLDRLNQLARILKCSIYDFLPEHPL